MNYQILDYQRLFLDQAGQISVSLTGIKIIHNSY